eukprot:10176358-Heterocapsa_arctica.AAC.1
MPSVRKCLPFGLHRYYQMAFGILHQRKQHAHEMAKVLLHQMAHLGRTKYHYLTVRWPGLLAI